MSLKGKEIKITIVIPSFNQGNYIEETIRSVASQKYENKELIVIDAGSTDNTVDIIRKYEKSIVYWISEKDEGQAHAINKGLQRATGDVFNWLNSDDYLEEGALQSVVQAFQENPAANVVCGFTHCFYDDAGTTSHSYRMGLKDTATETLLNVEMNQPGTFYKTDIVEKLGGVNESFRYVMDDELWMRYLMKYGQGEVFLTDKLLAHFRLHGSSKSVGEGYREFGRERYSIYAWLAEKAELSEFLVEKIKEKNSITYVPQATWDLKWFDRQVFEGYFAGVWMHHFYRHFQYHEARSCFKKFWRGNVNRQPLKHLLFMLKLFVVPAFLLDLFRKAS